MSLWATWIVLYISCNWESVPPNKPSCNSIHQLFTASPGLWPATCIKDSGERYRPILEAMNVVASPLVCSAAILAAILRNRLQVRCCMTRRHLLALQSLYLVTGGNFKDSIQSQTETRGQVPDKFATSTSIFFTLASTLTLGAESQNSLWHWLIH